MSFGHPAIARRIAFRDYLRAHPDEACRYEVMKVGAAAAFKADLAKYTEAKAEWIEACEARAVAWAWRL